MQIETAAKKQKQQKQMWYLQFVQTAHSHNWKKDKKVN